MRAGEHESAQEIWAREREKKGARGVASSSVFKKVRSLIILTILLSSVDALIKEK